PRDGVVMKYTSLVTSLLGIGLLAASSHSAAVSILARRARLPVDMTIQEHGHETAVDMAKVPDAVKAAAAKILGKLDGCTASMEKGEDTVLYEIASAGAPAMKVTVKLTA